MSFFSKNLKHITLIDKKLFFAFFPPCLLILNFLYFLFYFQVINAILRLSHLLVCVNSSANFLIYYARGEKFRRAWIDTFGAFWCYCCAKSENTSTSSQITELQTTIQTNGHSSVLCTTVVEPINSNSATTATTTNSPSKQKLLNVVTKTEDFLTVQNHVFVGSNQNNSHDVEDVSL